MVSNAGGGPGAISSNPMNSRPSPQSISQDLPLSTKGKHPPSANKKAKEHLRELLRLGFNNLADPDVPYWEARLATHSHSLLAKIRKRWKTFIGGLSYAADECTAQLVTWQQPSL